MSPRGGGAKPGAYSFRRRKQAEAKMKGSKMKEITDDRPHRRQK